MNWTLKVAPCVGAWIETTSYQKLSSDKVVAPCVGAWIETPNQRKKSIRFSWSRPVWARGLKHSLAFTRYNDADVAPCVGAWIETSM